jgi:hypothetical protein
MNRMLRCRSAYPGHWTLVRRPNDTTAAAALPDLTVESAQRVHVDAGRLGSEVVDTIAKHFWNELGEAVGVGSSQ